MTHAAFLAAGFAALVIALPAGAQGALGEVIHRKLDAYGPWYTPAEAAFIRERCGYRADMEIRNVTLDGDVMTCADGRRVQSPQVRAIGRDVSRRAYARTRAVMADPEVRRAVAMVSDAAARRALADADARIAEAELERTSRAPRP